MTITNVLIKTSDRKWDWGGNDVMPGSDSRRIWWFWKRVSWDLTLGRASPVQLGGGLSVGDVGTVSIVKNCVSLSSCRKTKVKKWINISYLNNGESSVFRFSPHLYILHVFVLFRENLEQIFHVDIVRSCRILDAVRSILKLQLVLGW